MFEAVGNHAGPNVQGEVPMSDGAAAAEAKTKRKSPEHVSADAWASGISAAHGKALLSMQDDVPAIKDALRAERDEPDARARIAKAKDAVVDAEEAHAAIVKRAEALKGHLAKLDRLAAVLDGKAGAP